MIKKNPAMPPTGMHNDIALGTLTVGFGHSSAMEAIMPYDSVSDQASNRSHVVDLQ